MKNVIFSDVKGICDNINFDKSRSLSGYPITIASTSYFYDPSIKHPYKFSKISGKILTEILSPLNFTVNIVRVPYKSFETNGNETEIESTLVKILNGTFNTRVSIQSRRLFGDFWRSELNMYFGTEICFVVLDRNANWSDYFQKNHFFHFFVITVFVCLIIE